MILDRFLENQQLSGRQKLLLLSSMVGKKNLLCKINESIITPDGRL